MTHFDQTIPEDVAGDVDIAEKLKFMWENIPAPPAGAGPWRFRGTDYRADIGEGLVSIQRGPDTTIRVKEFIADVARHRRSWVTLGNDYERPFYDAGSNGSEYVFFCLLNGDCEEIPNYEI